MARRQRAPRQVSGSGTLQIFHAEPPLAPLEKMKIMATSGVIFLKLKLNHCAAAENFNKKPTKENDIKKYEQAYT
jgi:hypothetical protein